MSQVNKFNQINNPDYVYFDLQQTNIQNSTEQEQQPLKFLETRETPVIANTGDYYMSVARFQLDTYNLPVFVGEPDLSQTGTYDPDKTIYKVAMNITNGSFTTTANVTAGYNLTTQTTIANTLDLGKSVRTANTGTKDDICVAVSDTGFNAGEGRVFIWRGTTTSNSIAQQLVVNTANAGLGGSTGISDNGTRVVASTTALGSYLWEINNGVVTGATYIAGTGGASTTTISGDGTRIFVGRNLGASGLFALYSYTNSTVTQIGNSRSVGANGYCAKPGSLDNTGTNLIVMATNDTSGYIEFIVYVGTTTTYITNFGGAVGDNLGGTVAMSANGTYALATAVRTSGANSFIRVYKRAGSGGTTTWSNITTITSPVANSAGWGKSASMSSDGSTIIVSANNTQTIYIYKRGAGVETYTLYSTVVASNIDVTSVYFESVSINNTGDAFFSAKSPSFTTQGTLYNYTFTDARPSGTVIPVPSSLSSVPTIESVKWIKSIDSATAPTKNSLTGKNTALFSYYYCDNYNSFIAMVNKTFKLAYKNFIERIYNDWIVGINDAGITNQFLDITAIHYPTPPFIDWNETNLTADIYVTLLFETYQSAANAVIDNLNYSMPSTTWATVSTNYVGTPVRNTPLKFEVAFNAPLYSLFSSLPAKRKIITSSTGLKETYYVLNIVSSACALPIKKKPIMWEILLVQG